MDQKKRHNDDNQESEAKRFKSGSSLSDAEV